MAGARQRLRVARLAADVSVGATCADHAQLRAREQLVDADVRVVAAESLSLALLPAVELSMLHAVGGIKPPEHVHGFNRGGESRGRGLHYTFYFY